MQPGCTKPAEWRRISFGGRGTYLKGNRNRRSSTSDCVGARFLWSSRQSKRQPSCQAPTNRVLSGDDVLTFSRERTWTIGIQRTLLFSTVGFFRLLPKDQKQVFP